MDLDQGLMRKTGSRGGDRQGESHPGDAALEKGSIFCREKKNEVLPGLFSLSSKSLKLLREEHQILS